METIQTRFRDAQFRNTLSVFTILRHADAVLQNRAVMSTIPCGFAV